MSVITRPQLAVAIKDVSRDVKYPCMVQPKIDGIRCLKIDGQLVTRNFKTLPNLYIRNILTDLVPDGTDGELIGATNSFQITVSDIMTEYKECKFVYNVFDYVKDDLSIPYVNRNIMMKNEIKECEYVHIVDTHLVANEEELRSYESRFLSEGYEGAIIRSMTGRYKCGRSTLKEGTLLKLKRFSDAEAVVIDFEPLYHNLNEKTRDAFGNAERSSHQANKVADELLGSLLVRDVETGIQFSIGTGFDQATRYEIWENRDNYLGKLVKYKFFDIGVKDAPRFPTFIGFRHENDM